MKTVVDLGKISHNYRKFSSAFGGEIYYAIKANPYAPILRQLLNEGITGFDVASLREIALVRQISSQAALLYTHPIKTRGDIFDAYHSYSVRRFVVDSVNEFNKIADIVDLRHCEIMLRIKTSTPNGSALQNLDEKFGIALDDAAELLQKIAASSAKTGICFHVGSQQEDQNAHIRAARRLSDALAGKAPMISSVSIGGGFPARYNPATDLDFTRSIPRAEELRALPLFKNARIIAEPGRCLVADAAYSEVRIIGCDGDRIFIDDGVYGGLMDCGIAKMRYHISSSKRSAKMRNYTIFGPTCDSLDVLPGQYLLPETLQDGDILTVHSTGAYCNALTQDFNGLVSPSTFSTVAHPDMPYTEPQSTVTRWPQELSADNQDAPRYAMHSA